MANGRNLSLVLAAIALAQINPTLAAGNYEIIDVPKGETVDVYFEINLSGRVFLSVRNPQGEGCAEFWWIKWPFGTIEDLGKRCGNFALDLPGLTSFAVASKLRARSDLDHVKIIGAASETVAYDFPPITFP